MSRSVVDWPVAATHPTTPELAVTTTSLDTEGAVTTDPSTETTSTAEARSFEIDQTRSTARFEIDDEVLNGSPQHVVGTTDQVVGQILVDPSDPGSVEFSEIVLNARTLTSDSERRDRAMRGPLVLDSGSDEHELISYAVTSVDRLGAVTIGGTVDFTITGDLTIKGNTQPVVFDVTAVMVDANTIDGSAVAEITRDMFEIGIPACPTSPM